jgi:hypothetical protein
MGTSLYGSSNRYRRINDTFGVGEAAQSML